MSDRDWKAGCAEYGRKARKLARLVRVLDYRAPLRHGVAATIEHTAVPFPEAYRTVIDVGAGRGQFALFALHRFPAARIFSFEPLASSFSVAARVIGVDSRVELRRLAIGSEAGTAEIFVTADSDSSSLRRPTAEQTSRFPGTGTVETDLVEVTTLDEAFAEIQRPALLKLDLQGGELDALRGATRLLREVDSVFVECSFVELYEGQALADEVVCFLREAGFALKGIFSPTYGSDGTCLQGDLLFAAGTAL